MCLFPFFMPFLRRPLPFRIFIFRNLEGECQFPRRPTHRHLTSLSTFSSFTLLPSIHLSLVFTLSLFATFFIYIYIFHFFIVLYLLPEVTLLFFPLFLLFSSEVIYAVNIHSSPFSIFLKRFDMVHLFFHLALKSSD